MRPTLFIFSAIATLLDPALWSAADESPPVVQIASDELEDKIRGGMLAQIIGNLNGLPHEFKYIDDPGDVGQFTPSLPEGAFTDDDTDVEWVYLWDIARSGHSTLPPSQVAELWKRHINRRIFCANHYARQLMDLGFEPPWTGNVGLNPWADFNISGQFLCESFGLMAPAMPQTAARLGLNYTRTAIDGEPAQTTQLFTTMIAMAFVEADVNRLLDAGLAAIDPQCEVAEVVRQTRAICQARPDDWRAARLEIKRRWQTHGGAMRDRNGYELNAACTVAALLYGKQDFVETLRLAFNLGWDCDNNAATAGTIVGVWKGRRWMAAQGWEIADAYRNTTRDEMPMDETITSLEDKLIACARIVIAEQGGGDATVDQRRVYAIRTESPANVARLATADQQRALLRKEFQPRIQSGIAGSEQARAQSAYLAICLGEIDSLLRQSPDALADAVAALQKYPKLFKRCSMRRCLEARPCKRKRGVLGSSRPPSDVANGPLGAEPMRPASWCSPELLPAVAPDRLNGAHLIAATLFSSSAPLFQSNSMPRWLFWTLLTLLSWGIWAILGRELGDSLSQAHIQVVSTLGVFPILIALWLLPDTPPVGNQRRGVWLALGSGIVSCIANIPFYGLLNHGAKAATAVPVTALYPVVTVLLAHWFLKERITRLQLMGIALSLTAIYLLNVPSEEGLISPWLLMAAIPIVLWGVTALMQKLATDHVSGRVASIWFLLAFFPVAGMIMLFDPLNARLSPRVIGLASAVGFALMFGNLTFILAFASGGKASVIAPLAGLYPVVSIPIAMIAYGEKLDAREAIGIACALTAVVLLSYQHAQSPPQDSFTNHVETDA